MTSVRDILLEFDEVGSYEGSKNIDYDELRRSIDQLLIKLNGQFSTQFVLDEQIQDASFQCDIQLPEELFQQPEKGRGLEKSGFLGNINCAVRFSNFGRLATICFEEQCRQGVATVIREELSSAGFIYLPANELDIAYDGRFEDFKKVYGSGQVPTWWIRYFDYI